MLSEAGINYKADVLEIAWGQRITGRVQVEVELHAPNRIRRDIDNFTKVLLDSLTYAKVWQDDECVDLLLLRRGSLDIEGDGYCIVTIRPNF